MSFAELWAALISAQARKQKARAAADDAHRAWSAADLEDHEASKALQEAFRKIEDASAQAAKGLV